MAAAAFEHAAAALTAGDVALGRKLADEYAASATLMSRWMSSNGSSSRLSAKLASETRRAQHDIGEAVRIAESDFLVDVFVRSGPQVVGWSPNLSTRARTQGCGARRSREARSLRVDRSSPSP